MNLAEFFIKRKTFFWSLMVAILIAGVISFGNMPKLEDPAVCGKQCMIAIPYPGATAHEVELNVAKTVEKYLREIPNVRKVKSECSPSMAMFTVEFEMTVLMDDLEQYFDFVRRKINDLKPYLPSDCYDPVIIDDMMDVYGIFYSLTGDGYSYSELEDYAKYLQRELQTVKGVKRINVAGGRSEVIDIIISKEKLSRNGLIPTQIMLNLQNAGKTVNAGKVQSGNDKLQLRVSQSIKDENDVASIMIQTSEGKQMKLSDIAEIRRGFSEPQTNGFFVNGKPAMAICIAMENSAIVPEVGREVDKKMSELVKNLPVGMSTDKIFFQPEKVTNAISGFMINLVESVLIVILVLIFSMGFRSGVIIGFGLVLTICVSFPILLTLGTTLQRISLGAFIVAMGMLVDNSIVIMDGILTDKNRGFGPKTYLFKIGKKTAMPLLGATIIAAATFMGIYLSPDSAGEYAGDLFLVLCVCLLMSWVLALVQVPICAKSWLPVRPKKTDTELLNSPIHRFDRKTVAFLIGKKWLTIGVAVILLAVSMFGMTKVKNMFFPDFDYSQFVVEYYLPSQTDPQKVKHDLLEMTDMLLKRPDIERVAASMGAAPAHYCLVRPMTNGGDCYGELMVDCKDFKTVCKEIPEIKKLLREKYPDAYIRLRKYNFSISTSHTVEAQFSGPDPEVLRSLSAQAEKIMRNCEYVDPYTVQNNWKPKGKVLTAKYIREDALRSSIERSDVANALLAATDGMPVGVINNEDKMTIINLNVRNSDGSKIQDLNDIPVWSTLNLRFPTQDLAAVFSSPHALGEIQDNLYKCVPLSSVAEKISMDWEEQYIYRCNSQRAIEAECDHNPDLYEGTPAKVMSEIQDKIEAIPLPEGYTLKWIGEGELSTEAIGNIMKYVPLTLFLILGILLLLFNDWKTVFLILMCFPFVFCGIVPTLLVFSQPFTFLAILGFMGLMGMMIKNAIVLVDEIKRLRNENKMPGFYAVIEATTSRIRPVTMASLTTILGMLPLIGDPMYNSMAVTIISGLAVGTVITLILLPVFYAAFYKIKNED